MTPALKHPNRATINRANARHSTGPRTEAGKQRAKLNALRHGLTSQSVLLPTEDPAAYQKHAQEFLNEYQPQGPTERQLVQDLIDTSWRLNRVPSLEAELLSSADLDVHALGLLATYGNRLSRQFHKALDQLRDLQAARRHQRDRDLKRAAGLLEMHKHKGLPYDPAADGFVFSNDEIERHSERLMRLNQSHLFEYLRFDAPPQAHALLPGAATRSAAACAV